MILGHDSDTGEEVLQRSLLDTTFSLTSLSAHTEQKKHRISSEAGNKEQQDTKKHKTFTVTPLLQGRALPGIKNAASARSELPQD